MSFAYTKDSLDKHIRKLRNAQKLQTLADNIKFKFIDYVSTFVAVKYMDTDFVVQKSNEGITALGDGIGFREYGTGSKGLRSSYKGNLPKETLTFNTSLGTFSTQGWVYNYDSPFKIRNKKTKEIEGWIDPTTKQFTEGSPAYADMYRSLETGKIELYDMACLIYKEMKDEN